MPPGNIRLIFYALFSLLFLSCDNNQKKEDSTIPIIRLDPSQEDTLRTSDYFERIDLIRFDGVKSPEDFIEMGDKYLVKSASDYTEKYSSEFHIFDRAGKHLYQIGKVGRGPGEYLASSGFINLSQDSTLRILDYNKYLIYRLNGDLVSETPIETIKYPGFRYLWQDSLIVFFNMEILGFTPRSVEINQKKAENLHILYLYSITSRKLLQACFPMKDVTGLMVYNMLYKYRDTLCFYHDKDNRIYEIHPTHTKIRYRIDKGEYGRLQTQKEYLEATGKDVSYSRIDIDRCNETYNYVIGFYRFKRRFYIFIYDKKTGITKNYLRLHDDLMSLPVEKGVGRLDWSEGLIFKEDYLWDNYRGHFLDKMDQFKSRMGEEKWKNFCQTHPDFYRIYRMQTEKLDQQSDDYHEDRIIWRYHFK